MVEESAVADVDGCSNWHLVGEVTDIEGWAEGIRRRDRSWAIGKGWGEVAWVFACPR